MLRIDILCVGRVNAAWLADGCAEYLKRCGRMAQLRIVEIPEAPLHEESASEALIARALEKEGQALLERVRRGSRIVALCVEGRAMTSEGLADWMAEGAVSGQGDISFIIGSSHGLAKSVKDKAALRLSMSAMTFPHQLARLVLLEQVYRALSIQQGSAYHK